MISIPPVPMSIAKILTSQVVFMGYMLKALAGPIHGIRNNLKYCSKRWPALYMVLGSP